MVKLFLLHGRVKGATYPTLASSAGGRDAVRPRDGRLAPGLGLDAAASSPTCRTSRDLPAFEFSWLAGNPPVTHRRARGRGRRARPWAWSGSTGGSARSGRGSRQGLAILAHPASATWRAWSRCRPSAGCCRVASAYYFLEAFHVPRDPPERPAGHGRAGGRHLAAADARRARARSRRSWSCCWRARRPRATLLAFSVGMELAILAFNLTLGAAAAWPSMLKGFRLPRRRWPRPAPRRGGPPIRGPQDPRNHPLASARDRRADACATWRASPACGLEPDEVERMRRELSAILEARRARSRSLDLDRRARRRRTSLALAERDARRRAAPEPAR